MKWEQTRNGDQSCDHLTEERQMVTRTKGASQLAAFKGATVCLTLDHPGRTDRKAALLKLYESHKASTS